MSIVIELTHDEEVFLQKIADIEGVTMSEVIIREIHQYITQLPSNTEMRPYGLTKGLFEVPDAFFDPLPDDILSAFEGN